MHRSFSSVLNTMIPTVIFVPCCPEFDDSESLSTQGSNRAEAWSDFGFDFDCTHQENRCSESEQKSAITRWRGSGSCSKVLPTRPQRCHSPCRTKDSSSSIERRVRLRGPTPKLFKAKSLPPRLPPRSISKEMETLPNRS